jgi:hypothetical protein
MQNNRKLQTQIQGAQLIVLILGIAGVMVSIGKRDAQLERNIEDIAELRSISSDVLKASIGSQITDTWQNEQLQKLLNRIEKLER